MNSHPLWRPYAQWSEEEASRAAVGRRAVSAVEVVAPDPAWPEVYECVRKRLAALLGRRLLAVEHIGSTSVAGLWAKPVVDVDLTVPDSADEAAWLPDLETAGFTLQVREPHWEQHRCLRGDDPAARIHVWSPGAQEPMRHAAFRDRLQTDDNDCKAYGELKRELTTQGLDILQYNNAKAGLIYDIYERIFVADDLWPHDPHPRDEGSPQHPS